MTRISSAVHFGGIAAGKARNASVYFSSSITVRNRIEFARGISAARCRGFFDGAGYAMAMFSADRFVPAVFARTLATGKPCPSATWWTNLVHSFGGLW